MVLISSQREHAGQVDGLRPGDPVRVERRKVGPFLRPVLHQLERIGGLKKSRGNQSLFDLPFESTRKLQADAGKLGFPT